VAALRELAPPPVVSGARLVNDDDEIRLFDEELAAVTRAVAARRRQFATGRALLRELLEREVAIPVAPDRRPVLPTGVIASLAHDDEVAVAVIANDRHVGGLGIDVERVSSFGHDITASILRPDDDTDDPAMAFVVKEAAYKAWSRPDRPILDHHDVRIAVGDQGDVVATVLPTGERLPVQAVMVAGRWLALAVQLANG
jgi:4'-phosphopantetheinyl transferase EntD